MLKQIIGRYDQLGVFDASVRVILPLVESGRKSPIEKGKVSKLFMEENNISNSGNSGYKFSPYSSYFRYTQYDKDDNIVKSDTLRFPDENK